MRQPLLLEPLFILLNRLYLTMRIVGIAATVKKPSRCQRPGQRPSVRYFFGAGSAGPSAAPKLRLESAVNLRY
jgi:hypothetical protein